MPYDDPDPSDPSVLCGVSLPTSDDTTLEMARVFAEEFARLGLPEERIRALFGSPFYGAAYRCSRHLGAATIDRLIRESCSVWGRVRVVDTLPDVAHSDRSSIADSRDDHTRGSQPPACRGVNDDGRSD